MKADAQSIAISKLRRTNIPVSFGRYSTVLPELGSTGRQLRRIVENVDTSKSLDQHIVICGTGTQAFSAYAGLCKELAFVGLDPFYHGSIGELYEAYISGDNRFSETKLVSHIKSGSVVAMYGLCDRHAPHYPPAFLANVSHLLVRRFLDGRINVLHVTAEKEGLLALIGDWYSKDLANIVSSTATIVAF